MDYSKYTKEELLDVIDELSMLQKELWTDRVQEDKLNFAWAGNLGHWYLNFRTSIVYFNPLKVTVLGYERDELPEKVSYSFFTDKVHPDDYENTMQAMILNMKGEAAVYECEYRIQTKDGKWKWFYDRGRVTQRDENGKPLFAAGIVFDITEQKELEERLIIENKELTKAYHTDSLTNIKNRRAIMEELENRMEQTIKYTSPLTILLIDIDNFKMVNDTYGHTFGDKVLRGVAQIIKDNIRGLDTVGRYGGEEFLVILPNTSLESARFVANRICSEIAAHPFEDIQVTISGGIALYDNQKPDKLKTFIDHADNNLYQAKAIGKNRIVG
ncbi:sensor domain-containing diguanylate cyclase [Oceanobacillus sp. CAU 1775]